VVFGFIQGGGGEWGGGCGALVGWYREGGEVERECVGKGVHDKQEINGNNMPYADA